METKHITGAFVRIQRNGKLQDIDIAQLTDKELDTFLLDMPALTARSWVKCLAVWVRDNVKVDYFKS